MLDLLNKFDNKIYRRVNSLKGGGAIYEDVVPSEVIDLFVKSSKTLIEYVNCLKLALLKMEIKRNHPKIDEDIHKINLELGELNEKLNYLDQELTEMQYASTILSNPGAIITIMDNNLNLIKNIDNLILARNEKKQLELKLQSLDEKKNKTEVMKNKTEVMNLNVIIKTLLTEINKTKSNINTYIKLFAGPDDSFQYKPFDIKSTDEELRETSIWEFNLYYKKYKEKTLSKDPKDWKSELDKQIALKRNKYKEEVYINKIEQLMINVQDSGLNTQFEIIKNIFEKPQLESSDLKKIKLFYYNLQTILNKKKELLKTEVTSLNHKRLILASK